MANTPLLGQMTAVINCSIVQQGKSLANTVSVIFSLTHANSTAKSEHQINGGGGGHSASSPALMVEHIDRVSQQTVKC